MTLKRAVKNLLIIVLLLIVPQTASKANALDDSLAINRSRLNLVVGGELATGLGSLGGLYYLWYADYPSSAFHWFNDNGQWLLMDKFGHATSSYQLGRISYSLMRWSGVSENPSLVWGGGIGFAYLGVVELMDGFSEGWGASWGDLTANAFGTGLFIGQQLLWDQQRIALKYSFQPSRYAVYRPDLLGNSFIQEMLKDYNGQTYWLSFNVQDFLHGAPIIPDWLCVSFGYGADGLLGGDVNPAHLLHFPRQRQYYLSLDADLTRIPTSKPWLKTVLGALNFIKIPAPALALDGGKLAFYPLWF
jgi:hypothetical protein